MMLDFSYTFDMLAQLNSEHGIHHGFYQLLWVKKPVVRHSVPRLCSSSIWVVSMWRDSHMLKFFPIVAPNEKQGVLHLLSAHETST